jgi:ATP-binding cassette subfamily B protein
LEINQNYHIFVDVIKKERKSMLDTFPHYTQLDAMDCGPTCLRMVAKYYGRSYTLQTLREKSFITREGVSMLGISEAAESIGFRTTGVKVILEQLKRDVPLPCILHWNQSHFVVLHKIKKDRFHVADPASISAIYNEEEFGRCWISTRSEEKDAGTALLLEPGPEFYETKDEQEKQKRGLSFFFRYLTPYKREIVQL